MTLARLARAGRPLAGAAFVAVGANAAALLIVLALFATTR